MADDDDTTDESSATSDEDNTPAEKPKDTMQTRARTAPALDMAFGQNFEDSDGQIRFHTWAGKDPKLFRLALIEAIKNPRTKALYLAAGGVWVELPLGS